MSGCTSNLPLNDFTKLAYMSKPRNIAPRPSMMNVGRWRSKNICSKFCVKSGMTPWFKNSVNNTHLAYISYSERLSNLIKANQARGTKKKMEKLCIDKQFGRKCGTGGNPLVNTF